MPPSNQRRRNQLTDTAIEIIVRDGLHGLSHRAVDEATGVPRGTTSNYFRSREALLAGVIRRLVELHFTMIEAQRARYADRPGQQMLFEFVGGVVDQALTEFRGRYLAMFELALESGRRPELQQAFASVADEAMKLTHEMHRGGHQDIPLEDVELLNVFYNGVLFTSLVMPQTLGGRTPAEVTRDMLARILQSPANEQKENTS